MIKRQNNGASAIPIRHAFIVLTLNQSLSISNWLQHFRTNYTIQFRLIQFDSFHFDHITKQCIFSSIREKELHDSHRLASFCWQAKKKQQTVLQKNKRLSVIQSLLVITRSRVESKRKCHFIFVSKAKSEIIALKTDSKKSNIIAQSPSRSMQHDTAVSQWQNKSCNLNVVVVIISFSIEYQHEE